MAKEELKYKGGSKGVKVHIVKRDTMFGSVAMCGRFMNTSEYKTVHPDSVPICTRCQQMKKYYDERKQSRGF